MRALARHLSYANVVSTLCLFLLLGGAAYAAARLPVNSVGTRQLKTGAVTGAKIRDGTITGAKVDSRTLGIVPAALSADNATSAAKADRATSAASADRATVADRAASATSADRAVVATSAEQAANAANADLLGGSPASSFISSSQVGYIDQAFSGCSLAVSCVTPEALTIAGVTVRVTCENAAGLAGLVLTVNGGARLGYNFVREGTEARHGQFEGNGNVVTAVTTSTETVGATGTIVVRTPARIISLNFDATARAPTFNTAACAVFGTALAV